MSQSRSSPSPEPERPQPGLGRRLRFPPQPYLPVGGAGACPHPGASARTPTGAASLEGPRVVVEDLLGEASRSGMDPGLVLNSEAIKGPATRSPALGYTQRE